VFSTVNTSLEMWNCTIQTTCISLTAVMANKAALKVEQEGGSPCCCCHLHVVAVL
jgi:hypothetical protein